MAHIVNNLYCCADCACAIANGDTSGLDYYGAEYRAKWEKGVAENGYKGNPVIACPPYCDDSDSCEFNCDWCGRNVYSHKFVLAMVA